MTCPSKYFHGFYHVITRGRELGELMARIRDAEQEYDKYHLAHMQVEKDKNTGAWSASMFFDTATVKE